ncbi:glycoside hydrolase family 65 protein [Paucisalibacillus globulus]|uniref:glycoside hydrolase family 65 protein n=1 Tax=Paucisalibacillus globulus TaxID=351095 RepID=UPI00040D7FC4|nr:glycosyl hydrolase family 65 protein [Paucisalibacillus globulus]
MSWKVESKSTDIATLLQEESLFFNGNGYMGIRGNLEEGLPSDTNTIRGSYINGFHDIVEISYGEKLYAFPENQQKLLNIIDAQGIEIWVGEDKHREKVSLHSGKIIDYTRILHLDKGLTERRLHWRSNSGHELNVNFKRFVSFHTKELFQQYITLTPISEDIPVRIVSSVNGDVKNFADKDDPRVASDDEQLLAITNLLWIDESSFVEVETTISKLRAAALSTVSVSDKSASYRYEFNHSSIQTTIDFTLSRETILEKRTFIADSRRYQDLQYTLQLIKDKTASLSFKELANLQLEYMTSFWKNTDVTITGGDKIQEAIRFNLFHLLQSAGQDGKTSIAAKGLSGEGYEGHYFWDTEIYLLPMFTMTNPELAKKLLHYRYSILDSARERAREMGHKNGALYPWRTITGTECSSYYPAGTAQYHISADIAYSYVQYFLATNDLDFVKVMGAEVLIETARLWLEVGHFHQNGEFRIDTVTGPDEYTAIVNNNYYTNVMAKYNLQWAIKFVQFIQSEDPLHWQSLKSKLSLKDSELEAFQSAADAMYLPIDKTLNINSQDDTFLQKEIWDFEGTPKEHYPLLLHYHPLTIYRYQVCKQADTVLAHFLVEDEQPEDIIKESYNYYEKITTHDSSLSSCVFSMMGARIGYLEKAYDYFLESARLDLDNRQGNTKDGLHMANMGGTWMAIVTGFAGLRLKENGLHFRPQLPEQWEGYAFHIRYHGRLLKISSKMDSFTVELLSGVQVDLHIWDKKHTITADSTLVITN